MIKVNLFDMEFFHSLQQVGYFTCSDTLKPTKIEWLNRLMEYDDITVFTDRFIYDPIVDFVKTKTKVAWLLEPRAINPNSYNNIINLEDKFDYILTYDTNLLKKGGKYLKYVVGQSRVNLEDAKIYDKNKLVSMIASNKTYAIGHNFRHIVANSLASKRNIDMWGSGYKYFTDKREPLQDYYFSISIMNSNVDNYFTEVLVDNFMLGTIPIFWGCPNIGDYFDIDGIITFNTLEELDNILENLTVEDYYKRLDSVKRNLEIAKKYVSTDDRIADILTNINV